jgi:hypothetical protein
MKPRLVETIDRQREKKPRTLRGEHDGTAAAELCEATLDQHAIRGTEHSASRVSVPVFRFTHLS